MNLCSSVIQEPQIWLERQNSFAPDTSLYLKQRRIKFYLNAESK